MATESYFRKIAPIRIHNVAKLLNLACWKSGLNAVANAHPPRSNDRVSDLLSVLFDRLFCRCPEIAHDNFHSINYKVQLHNGARLKGWQVLKRATLERRTKGSLSCSSDGVLHAAWADSIYESTNQMQQVQATNANKTNATRPNSFFWADPTLFRWCCTLSLQLRVGTQRPGGWHYVDPCNNTSEQRHFCLEASYALSLRRSGYSRPQHELHVATLLFWHGCEGSW